MAWPLYSEVSHGNGSRFSMYRCPDPVATKTGEPWYGNDNVCPCDPKLSNMSGRGYTACPLGIYESAGDIVLSPERMHEQFPKKGQMIGSLFSGQQFVPPQYQPRQLIRIGQSWRNTN